MKRIKKYLVVIFSAAMLTLLGTVVIEAAPGSLNEIVTQFGRNNPGSAVVVSNLTDSSEARLNGGTSFTSASLYKLFVAEYLFKEREAGNLSFNQRFTLKDVATQHEENVSDCNGNQACVNAIWPSIPTGQSATVAECLNKMIIYSDNICGKTFLDEARKKYSKVPGYTGTFFSPLRTNANDVAKLMSDIAKETWVSKASSQEMYALLKQQYHKEKIPAGLPPGTEFGNKTGEIHSVSNGKSHDAAIVKAGDKTYVLVVLTNKNPDVVTTKQRIAGLSKQVYEFIAQGVANDDPANSTCAPEASVETVSGVAASNNINDILLELEAPLYDPDGPACCDASLGGPSDGGPLTGVRFPAVEDTAALAKAIEDYIKKGWPTSPLIPFADDYVRFGQEYDVNPTIAVIISQVEYQFGTAIDPATGTRYAAPGRPDQFNYWAVQGGPLGSPDRGVRFDAYPSIIEAMEDHFKLLAGVRSPGSSISYIGPPQNHTTISQIMGQYAPASDNNDTARYIKTIEDGMRKLLSDAGVSTGDGGGGTVTGGCSVNGGADSGFVSSEGYAFPIDAKKKSDIATFGALNSLPCNNASGCHHTGAPGGGSWPPSAAAAFDLGVTGYGPDASEGAPVFAISDGRLVNVNSSSRGSCNSITLKSSKDGFIYWYGHLKQDFTVKTGQEVRAGQKIGNVGKRTPCADGTAPHLHIDRVPEGGSPGSGPSRDAGIIELINNLYEELPD